MPSSTSWEESGRWYDTLVGEAGHYYHRNIVIPGTLRLLKLGKGDALLDLACGQGILARHLPKEVDYIGIDLSPTLIKAAQAKGKGRFVVGDITKPFPIKPKIFTHASCLLALQNLSHPEQVFTNLAPYLCEGGAFAFVINHPCFRIPRQSHWGVDEGKKVQYRRIDRYFNPLKIPITTHPGKGASSQTTWSFHQPLSFWFAALANAGFVVTGLEEWRSDKKSTGAKAKMENLARDEFPLFLAIIARKEYTNRE